MANRRISDSDREATLRRVAIVLRALPSHVAAELMGSMSAQARQSVRQTMATLADVDPLEQRRALHAFKVSLQQQPAKAPATPAHTHDEVSIQTPAAAPTQPTSRVVPSADTVASSTPAETSPLGFLADVDDDVLVRLLAAEHPQTIALVLASISASHAARLIPRLDSRTQADALGRVGRLGEIPKGAIEEIAEHFQQRIDQQPGGKRSGSGQRALHAILAELPAGAEQSAPPATHVPPATHAPPRSVAPVVSAPGPIADESFPPANDPAQDLTQKLRVAEHTWPTEDQPHQREAAEAPTSPVDERASNIDALAAQQALGDDLMQQQEESDETSVNLESTDSIHSYLLQLRPLDLCHALGSVETRAAMLALCGLPNQTAEAVLEILPRAKAKQVRASMNSLGSLQLREIDEAKEMVARASVALLSETPANVPLAA